MMTVVLLVASAQSAFAVVASDDPTLHRVAAGEIRYGLNLDGVALIGWEMPGGASVDEVIARCSGAAISDRHLLTAAHCFDADEDGRIDSELSWFPLAAAFELPGEVTHSVPFPIQNVHIPDDWPSARADIAVIELPEELPASIPRYRGYGGFDEVNGEVVVAGYGLIGTGQTGVDWPAEDSFQTPGKHAGLNRVEAVYVLGGAEYLAYDFDNGLPEQNALAFDDFESDLGLGADEAVPAYGDSGGPVFLDGAIAGVIALGRRLRLPGVDITDRIDASWGEAHADTRVATFQHFLIDATGDAVRFHKLVGDYDNSGRREAIDIDLLSAAQREASTDPAFDLKGSGTLDADDRLWWVHRLARTHLGDANLDRLFDSGDLVTVLASGKYGMDATAVWSEGDWNGDGRFDDDDLVVALQDGGYEQPPGNAVRAVPEPTSRWLAILCAAWHWWLAHQCERRKR